VDPGAALARAVPGAAGLDDSLAAAPDGPVAAQVEPVAAASPAVSPDFAVAVVAVVAAAAAPESEPLGAAPAAGEPLVAAESGARGTGQAAGCWYRCFD